MIPLAVIIPTWNEAEQISAVIGDLQTQTFPPAEILVADAGSNDGTCELAQQLGVSTIRCTERGRGNQIYQALMETHHDAIVVVHADTRLAKIALEKISHALAQDSAAAGGCLGHRFDRRPLLLRLVEWGDWFRARWLGRSLGDQVQFFRKSLLDQVGGFPKQPIMEDVELARRLKCHGKPLYLNCPALTSARRFERLGIWKTLIRNARLRSQYARLGSPSAQKLFEKYYAE